MTKSTGTARKKYDFLDKKGTTKARQDYIETNYVDGVKDLKTGEMVIRKMNDEEREWLSQFISETEHGNLNKSSQIKVEVRNLKNLRSEHRTAKRHANIDEMARLEPLIEAKLQYIEVLRESCNNFYTTEEDVKEIYSRDNERRRDVYNNAKINDNLVLYELTEYDKFSTEAITDIDPEHLILEHLTTIPVRKRFKGRD